jgi:hypothetical protein
MWKKRQPLDIKMNIFQVFLENVYNFEGRNKHNGQVYI